MIARSVTTNVNVLAPGTTYYFRVCAESSGGYSAGQIMRFTTASPGSLPVVTTMAATSVGATGATLNGSVIPNGLATDAWFEWGTDSTLASYSTTEVQAVGSGTTSQAVHQALTGLTTGTLYYYRVAASNVSGTSKGIVLSFLPGAAPTVTTLTVTGVGTTGATLNGSVNPNGLGDRSMVRVGNKPGPGHLRHVSRPGAGGRDGFPAGHGDPVRIEFRDDLLPSCGCLQLDGDGEGCDCTFHHRIAHHLRVVSTTPANNATDVPLDSPSRSPSTRTWNPPPSWTRSP